MARLGSERWKCTHSGGGTQLLSQLLLLLHRLLLLWIWFAVSVRLLCPWCQPTRFFLPCRRARLSFCVRWKVVAGARVQQVELRVARAPVWWCLSRHFVWYVYVVCAESARARTCTQTADESRYETRNACSTKYKHLTRLNSTFKFIFYMFYV